MDSELKKSPTLTNVKPKPKKYICGWNMCCYMSEKKIDFYNHVSEHIPQIEIAENEEGKEMYVCKWTSCDFCTQPSDEIVRHVKYHAFHTCLKVLGALYAEKKKLPVCAFSEEECNIVPSQTDPLICNWDNCGLESIGQQEYINHVLEEHLASLDKKNGQFLCYWRDCKSSSTNKNKLLEHVRIHTGERVIACPNCGQLFANNTKYSTHCYRQLVLKDQSYQCNHCLSSYPTERILRDHMRQHVHHYKCTFCSMTCTTPSILATHIRYRHIDHQPFKCPSCPHKCKTQRDLREHLLTHDSNHRYTCSEPDCEFTARSRISLSRHFEKVHTNDSSEGTFCCHLCDKRYTRGVNLTKHLLSVHNVRKPQGYPRFSYCLQKDGCHRLQTIRLESLDVSEFMDSDYKAYTSDEENVDDPNEREEMEISKPCITIDILDEKGNLIRSESVAPENSLPPEATVVAIAQ